MEDYKTRSYQKKPFEQNRPPKNAPKLPQIKASLHGRKDSIQILDPSVNEANRVAQGTIIEVGDTPCNVKGGAMASGQMLIAASKASIVKTESSGKSPSPLQQMHGKHYSNMQIKIDQLN